MIVPLKSRLLWFQFVAIVSAVLTRPAKAPFGLPRGGGEAFGSFHEQRIISYNFSLHPLTKPAINPLKLYEKGIKPCRSTI